MTGIGESYGKENNCFDQYNNKVTPEENKEKG